MSDAVFLAVGVAFSPLPIATVTLILSGTNTWALGSPFAVGWIAGVAPPSASITRIA